MSDANSPESSLEAAAGRAGPHATEAFGLLGNETRMAILLALWEAYEPGAEANAVAFSDLYERVDYDNPGNFSYHLEKLSDQFIQQHPEGDGYELRTAGLNLVQAVIAGAGGEDTSLGPAEIDRTCWLCDGPAAVTYRDGVLYLVCTECEGRTADSRVRDGYLNSIRFPPAGLADHRPDELYAAGTMTAYRHMRTMLEGLCSTCSGPVEAAVEYCRDHDPDGLCGNCGRAHAIGALFQCRVCKDYHATKPSVLAIFHPAVIAFYDEHGVSTQWHVDDYESVKRVTNLVTDHEMELVSADPLRVAVTISYEGDELRLTYDETVTVVDVSR